MIYLKAINKNELKKGLLVIGGYLIIPSFLFNPLKFFIKKGIFTTLSANVAILLIMAIIFGLIYRKDLINDLKINFKKVILTTLKYWLIGFIIMYISSLIIELFKLAPNVNQEANIALLKEAPVLEFILAVILAPFVEELVFRRSLIKAINNKHIYAIITGLMFAFIHVTSSLSQGSIMLLYLIPYAAVGIAFGYSYYKTKNIYGTMIIHSFHNLLSLLALLFI